VPVQRSQSGRIPNSTVKLNTYPFNSPFDITSKTTCYDESLLLPAAPPRWEICELYPAGFSFRPWSGTTAFEADQATMVSNDGMIISR
jgi:hypothetical protein